MVDHEPFRLGLFTCDVMLEAAFVLGQVVHERVLGLSEMMMHLKKIAVVPSVLLDVGDVCGAGSRMLGRTACGLHL